MADYYFDNNRGDDSNDGLSSASAWKDPFVKLAATSGWAAGDNILFAADSVWNFTDRRNLQGFIGTSSSPGVIIRQVFKLECPSLIISTKQK